MLDGSVAAGRAMQQRYYCDQIRELKDQQTRYAPLDKRLEQADRAELLMDELEPEKKYSYPEIVFRITGFRPDDRGRQMMRGCDLQHDLRLFVEDLSASVRLDAAAVGEPVLTIEELSRQTGYSAKTISRWRNQGLVSRRFVFGGRLRVGFLKSSVDRFIARNKALLSRQRKVKKLSDEEREKVVARARRLSAISGRRPTDTEIARRVADRFGRCPETIRYTIRQHDAKNPDRAVFGTTARRLTLTQKMELYQNYKAGIPVADLARKFHRTRSSVYRIINEMRARELLERDIEFIYNEVFDEPDAEQLILGPMPKGTPAQRKGGKPPKGLPAYLASLYEVPLLTREQEVYLFRKMNYLKYKAHRLREGLESPAKARASTLDEIERLLKEAEEVKNQIVRANLRLVVSIAKKHVSPAQSFDELISDGNMSLMRAVEKFDFGRGNKFSTYASWAIMKNYARSIPAELHQRDRYLTGQEEVFQTTADPHSNEQHELTCAHEMRESIRRVLSQLNERERMVIIWRFGLGGRGEPQTLEQLGRRLGVTKERARQIVVQAIGKLRKFAEEEHIGPLDA